jgi:hypothetical protein
VSNQSQVPNIGTIEDPHNAFPPDGISVVEVERISNRFDEIHEIVMQSAVPRLVRPEVLRAFERTCIPRGRPSAKDGVCSDRWRCFQAAMLASNALFSPFCAPATANSRS